MPSTETKTDSSLICACLQTAELHAAALAEDASIFDYDGVFEDMQAKKEKPKAAEPAARKSRYIESLMDKAKDRQREQDIVYERR